MMKKLKEIISYPRVKTREKWVNGPLKEFHENLIKVKQSMDEKDSIELLADLLQNTSLFQDTLFLPKYKYAEYNNVRHAIKNLGREVYNENPHVVRNYNIRGFDKNNIYLEVDQFFITPQPINYFLGMEKEDRRRIAAEETAKKFVSESIQHLLNTVDACK